MQCIGNIVIPELPEDVVAGFLKQDLKGVNFEVGFSRIEIFSVQGAGEPVSGRCWQLFENMNDSAILQCLPKHFDVAHVLALVVGIVTSADQEEQVRLRDGRVNVTYLSPALAVWYMWQSVFSKWTVGLYEVNDANPWASGVRILMPEQQNVVVA